MPEFSFSPKICGIVDERGEIAAMYKGIPQNDIGENSDVIENISKELGINLLVRSMSPQIIVCDEIGSLEDIKAIQKAVCSGVKGIFTVHGASIEELKQNPYIKEIIENELIQRIIFIGDSPHSKISLFRDSPFSQTGLSPMRKRSKYF